MTRTPSLTLQRLFYISTVVLSLVYCLSWYRSSFFYYDDFNCMFLAQQETFWSMLEHILNPISTYFRPLYMMAYWVNWKLFGLIPWPYHWVKWLLHGFNVGLLYLVLRHLTGSRYGSALAALLFSYQIAFREIFFNFACLGEILCAALMWGGLWTYTRIGITRKGLLWSYFLFFFALKAKEMAVTLPLIWLAYDFTVREGLLLAWLPGSDPQMRQRSLVRLGAVIKRLSLSLAMSFGYLWLKLPQMGGLVPLSVASPTHPYFIDRSLESLPGSFAWYFNSLFRIQLTSGEWLLIWIMAIGVFMLMRNRAGVFFFLYIFIAFIPVIPLVNRRLPYYWYIPSFGIGGLIALAAKGLEDRLKTLITPRKLEIIAALCFLTISYVHYNLQKEWTRPMMIWVDRLTRENRSFIAGLERLPQPRPNATVYFQSVPRYFDGIAAKSVVQVVFRRTDLDGKIVSECLPDEEYCVGFNNSRVVLIGRTPFLGGGPASPHSSGGP
jgi:hypothetical protein